MECGTSGKIPLNFFFWWDSGTTLLEEAGSLENKGL